MKNIICFACLITLTLATTINIPTDYPTIQQGIEQAAVGDLILIQPGLYQESINFLGKDITVSSLYITTNDKTYIDQTIIDLNNAGVVLFANNETNNAMLTGLTIRNGSGYSINFETVGGGICCCNNSSPTLQHLIIENCQSNWGGGITILQSSAVVNDMTIRNCNGTPHDASSGFGGFGGGILIMNSPMVIINDSHIYTNHCFQGGGVYVYESMVTLNRCAITNNTGSLGAGLYVDVSPQVEINHCQISNNFAHDPINMSIVAGGGGINVNDSNLLINSTVISDNTAEVGAGIYVADISNHLMVINKTTIVNNTNNDLLDNEGGPGIRGMDNALILVLNSIIWNNTNQINEEAANIYLFNDSSLEIAYSDIQSFYDGIQGNCFFHSGNLDADPLFVTNENSSYIPSEFSPCIDGGHINFVFDNGSLVTTSPNDFLGGAPDFGAYEFPDFVPGDINGDGQLNVIDLIEIIELIINEEFSEEDLLYCDVSDDNLLNISDIIILVIAILAN
ncbi:MAG: right-handed parallel beta-helix repeat-containing protein [Candidatus Komeilibacteria bacterium]